MFGHHHHHHHHNRDHEIKKDVEGAVVGGLGLYYET